MKRDVGNNSSIDFILSRRQKRQCEMEQTARKSHCHARSKIGKRKRTTMDEQVALMEKSYELAAKYMGNRTARGGGTEPADRAVQKTRRSTETQ